MERKRRILVNYADDMFKNAQKYNTKMGYRKGKFDEVWEYAPADFEARYNSVQREIKKRCPLRFEKYGLWRPYLLKDACDRLSEGEYLFYLDSGAFFIKSVEILIAELEADNGYMMCFDIPTLERQWTKRDVFYYLNADEEKYLMSPQRMSGLILIKKCERSDRFLEKFVDAADHMPELFTDSENMSGKPDYSDFIENRHNQSVFSILSKKEGILAYRDPTEMGDMPELYARDSRFKYTPTVNRKVIYSKVIISHRYPKITVFRKIKLIFRSLLPAKIYFGISYWLAGLRTEFGTGEFH